MDGRSGPQAPAPVVCSSPCRQNGSAPPTGSAGLQLERISQTCPQKTERVTDGAAMLYLIVRDLDVERFLEGHGQSDKIQRIRPKLAKPGFVADQLARNREMLRNHPSGCRQIHPKPLRARIDVALQQK